MADTISLCFNNAEIMLDCIYEDYESEIENFLTMGMNLRFIVGSLKDGLIPTKII